MTTYRTILDVAQARFADSGYAAVSMRDIAEEVGIRPSAIYNHFASKQDILVTLMETHLGWLMTAWDEARPRNGDPLAELDAFAAFHVRHHIDRPQAVFIAYMELRNLEAENRRIINDLRAAYEGELRRILANGRRHAGFTVEDPAVAARAIIAMLTGVTTWYSAKGMLGTDQIIAIYTNLTRRCVGVETTMMQEAPKNVR